jgi:hypothetical protein
MSPLTFSSILDRSWDSIRCSHCNQSGKHTSGVSILPFLAAHLRKRNRVLIFPFPWHSHTVLLVTALCNLSVCIGVHRLWSHRSFKCVRGLKLVLLFFYTMAGQVRKSFGDSLLLSPLAVKMIHKV